MLHRGIAPDSVLRSVQFPTNRGSYVNSPSHELTSPVLLGNSSRAARIYVEIQSKRINLSQQLLRLTEPTVILFVILLFSHLPHFGARQCTIFTKKH